MIIKKTSISYNSFKLEIPNIIFDRGVYLIQGPNGCGKSTFVKHLIECFSFNKCEDSCLGYLPQNYNDSLFPWLSIYKNYSIFNLNIEHHLNKLNELNFPSYRLNCKPTKLSGGQRQKVALLKEFLLSTKYLILDEPFSSLDHHSIRAACMLLKEHLEKFNSTIIIIAHNILPDWFATNTEQIFFTEQHENAYKIQFNQR